MNEKIYNEYVALPREERTNVNNPKVISFFDSYEQMAKELGMRDDPKIKTAYQVNNMIRPI